MSYVLYGGELSLFSRKLEAALIFYQADFEFKNKNEADVSLLETRAGTHQVPLLLTPENWMLADTTPIMNMLDARFPGREMFPSGPAGVLVHCLEEYFDEWVARVMVHYRWHYPASAEFAAMKMANGNQEIAQRVMTWGPRACRATGTESEHQRLEVEKEYARILVAAEAQLKQTAFLLGDRPTAVDCIVLGGLRAHTNMDPDPKKVTAKYPTVIQWSEQRADQWDGGGVLPEFPASTEFAETILAEMPDTYGVFARANAEAQTHGAKACRCETYGEEVSYLSRPYPEQARRMVNQRIEALDAEAKPQVDTWLKDHRLDKVFSNVG